MIDIGNAQIIGTRDKQEDYFASIEIGGGVLSIVSDGMGGYEGGEVASQISVKFFIKFFKDNFNTKDIGKLLLDATHYTNSKLEDAKAKDSSLDEMGSTIVAVYMTNQRLYWVSVGDSLLYRYSGNQLKRLNADHSVAGELQKQVDAGEITQQEANNKPNRHALTSAMTGYVIPFIEQSDIQVEDNDRFIIASDGIHTLSNQQITHTASRIEDNQQLTDTLVGLIEKKKEKNQDNTTIVTLQLKVELVDNSDNKVDIEKKSIATKLLIGTIIILLGIIIFLLYSNFDKSIIFFDENKTEIVEHNKTTDINLSMNINRTSIDRELNITNK